MSAMNAKLLELALRKQRLQIESDRLRAQWQGHAQGLAPALGIVDRTRTGLHWLRRHPAVPVGIGVAVAVAKPRFLWRWAKRALLAWQFWRRAQGTLR
jgi:hypothetical protein